MAFEMKPNTGSLFKNEKRTSDTHPNATGSVLIDGVAYFCDAWTNDGPGGKYQSLKFKRKDKQPGAAPSGAVTRAHPPALADMDSDIPF